MKIKYYFLYLVFYIFQSCNPDISPETKLIGSWKALKQDITIVISTGDSIHFVDEFSENRTLTYVFSKDKSGEMDYKHNDTLNSSNNRTTPLPVNAEVFLPACGDISFNRKYSWDLNSKKVNLTFNLNDKTEYIIEKIDNSDLILVEILQSIGDNITYTWIIKTELVK